MLSWCVDEGEYTSKWFNVQIVVEILLFIINLTCNRQPVLCLITSMRLPYTVHHKRKYMFEFWIGFVQRHTCWVHLKQLLNFQNLSIRGHLYHATGTNNSLSTPVTQDLLIWIGCLRKNTLSINRHENIHAIGNAGMVVITRTAFHIPFP